MIHIAVCDDSFHDLRTTERMLNEYQNENPQIELVIDTFSLVEKLYEELLGGKRYDAYILDIVMPKMGGIELGELIRKKNKDVPIIYTTSSPEFALGAYQVQAIRYLLKPVEKLEFQKAMDFLLQIVPENEPVLFDYNAMDGLRQIAVHDIETVENCSRRMELTKTNGECVISKCIRNSFEDCVKPLLEGGTFVQTHKSYVVNMAYIRKLSVNSLEMDSGRTIPISKNNSTQVKKVYLKYLSSEE